MVFKLNNMLLRTYATPPVQYRTPLLFLAFSRFFMILFIQDHDFTRLNLITDSQEVECN